MSKSPHSFTVSQGSDELSLEFCGNSSYLRFNNPVAVSFSNQGDGFEFYDLTPGHKSFRQEINLLIGDKLNESFNGDEPEFLKSLEPLLAKLHNGKYALYLHAEEQFGLTIRSEPCDSNLQLMEMVFGKTIEVLNTEKTENAATVREKSIRQLANENLTDLYDAFEQGDDYCFGCMTPILATKTSEEMDLNAVRYFEEKIRENEMPMILLFQSYLEHQQQSSNFFLLDGHHKFKAYQNLKIVPRVVVVSRVYNASDLRFLPDQLIDCLNEWQNRFVFETVYFPATAAEWMRENPESKVHSFVRNGLIRTHYDNGQLQHEAHYHFNRIEGLSRTWYQNGMLEFERNFVDGFRKGNQRRYYESSKLWEEITIDGPGTNNNSKLVWYESGARKMEAAFHSGMYSEVIPIRTWFENGQAEKELLGTNRKNYESKLRNEEGELIEHFIVENGKKNWIIQPANRNLSKTIHPDSRSKYPATGKTVYASYKPFDFKLLWIILVFALGIARLILYLGKH